MKLQMTKLSCIFSILLVLCILPLLLSCTPEVEPQIPPSPSSAPEPTSSPSEPNLPPATVPIPSEVQEVTFEQLFLQPDQYSGKDIVIEGFYYQGFETIVLSENLAYSGHAPGHLVPEGKMIWIEKGIPKEIYDNAYQQQMLGPLERYGKVRMKGQFEYGGGYGHLGQYEYQIIPTEVELLDWTPAPE